MRRLSSFGLVMVLLIVLTLALSSSLARTHHLQAVLGTGFTYQGRLTDGGAPANGTCDFEFKLYDDPTGGAQIGPTLTKDEVTVSDGLFTVMLDFGAIFDGTALYLEIAVRPGSDTGAYTTLTPRQPLTTAPYAGYSLRAVERAERRPGRLCRRRGRRHVVWADLRRWRIAQRERLGLDLRCR